MDKHQSRLRRSKRTRAKIRELGVHRLSVHRTPRHIYAQVISPCGRETLITVSTVQPSVRELIGTSSKGNCAEAEKVGALVAQQCLEKGIKTVAFDRSGNKYHGRIRALAEKAREAGLEF